MRHFMATTFICLCMQSDFASADATFDGLWRSDGYGLILEISGNDVRLFSTGIDVCIPENDMPAPIEDVLPGVTFRMSEDESELLLTAPLEPHPILTRRLTSLPPGCTQVVPQTPVAVFETFVQYYDANYPFFELHDVEWSQRVSAARQRVNADMSDRALFDVLDWLIAPLRDGHVSLVAEIDGDIVVSAPGRASVLKYIRQGAEATGRNPTEAAREFRHAVWFESISQDILDGQGQLIGNDRIQYGMVEDRIGYLAFASLDGFGDEESQPAEGLQAFDSMLDEIMGFFEASGAKGLMLDLSLNFGGSDYMARAVASRFLHNPTVAYTKYAADAEDPVSTRVSIEPNPTRFGGGCFPFDQPGDGQRSGSPDDRAEARATCSSLRRDDSWGLLGRAFAQSSQRLAIVDVQRGLSGRVGRALGGGWCGAGDRGDRFL